MSNIKNPDLDSMIDTARYCRRKAAQLGDKVLRVALLDLADACEKAAAQHLSETPEMAGRTLH